MEMILKNGFCELEQNEMLEVDGGDIAETVGGIMVALLGGMFVVADLKNVYKAEYGATVSEHSNQNTGSGSVSGGDAVYYE